MIGFPYLKLGRLNNLEIVNTLTVGGESAITSLPEGILTLSNIGDLDFTTLETVLSEITQATQHHIGCLIVSDMSYAKTLYLPADATDSSAKSMYDTADNAVYTVPAGKVFLAGKVSYFLDHGSNRGRIGEGTGPNPNGQITYDQMCFGNGQVGGGNASCPGIFTANKYVNAESTGGYSLRVPTMLYGIEVTVDGDGVITEDELIVQFDIGGYICEDYRELKTLICTDQPTSSEKKTFHEWNGSGWVNYDVPTGYVYIAGAISYWTEHATSNGIIGESVNEDSTLSRQVFMFGNANADAGFQEVYGRFTEEKWVTAQATSYALRKPTYIYGVEIVS